MKVPALSIYSSLASLLPTSGDRIVKVNGGSIIGKAYGEVIALIQQRWVEWAGPATESPPPANALPLPQQWRVSRALCDAKGRGHPPAGKTSALPVQRHCPQRFDLFCMFSSLKHPPCTSNVTWLGSTQTCGGLWVAMSHQGSLFRAESGQSSLSSLSSCWRGLVLAVMSPSSLWPITQSPSALQALCREEASARSRETRSPPPRCP